MDRGNLKKIIYSGFFSLIPTLLIWIPFLFRLPSLWHIPLPQQGLATIVANYDGPLYIVAAKTLYDKELISTTYQFPLPTEYYTAHFPLFPLLIKLFGLLMNYPYAMLIVTLFSSFLAIYFFYKLVSDYVSEENAMFLTFLFSIFPARWLIVRSVGSADPLFIASIIASLYFFKNKKYLWAGLWGAVAQMTKSPAVLLFISYIIYLVLPIFKNKLSEIKKAYPLILIPVSLLFVFGLYAVTQNDFFAYFHSGDNIHLFFPPFQIFNYSAPWVGTFWLEEIIFIYLIGSIGVFKLFKQENYELAVFSAIYFASLLFVSHRDVMRYALPIVPFLIISFSDFLTKKEFKWSLLILIIPIYLFSLAFISQNVMPISNWAPFI
jgi:Gpi18-like mannosyltransferase